MKLGSIIRKIVGMGFPVKDNLISYYSITDKVFVFAGREPLGEDVTIPSDDIDVGQRLVIKYRASNNISPSIDQKKATPILNK